jgi:hypothetical protein
MDYLHQLSVSRIQRRAERIVNMHPVPADEIVVQRLIQMERSSR